MKVLLIGRTGQVGSEIHALLHARGIDHYATSRNELDLTALSTIQETMIQHTPDVVINASAYTAVDKAEEEIELAQTINHHAVKEMALFCEAKAIPFIHLSTDYVFDGKAKTPYKEDDPVNPLGVYGNSKYAGEEAIRALCSQHIILRISWVFGQNGHNFVKTMARLFREKDAVNVVDDQIGCPTPACDVAQLVLVMLGRLQDEPWGTYHYCGTPSVSWYGFAKKIREVMTGPLALKALNSITTEEYPTPAKRPAYSILNTEKMLETFGFAPLDWRLALRNVLELDDNE